jgi:hypothetical protein
MAALRFSLWYRVSIDKNEEPDHRGLRKIERPCQNRKVGRANPGRIRTAPSCRTRIVSFYQSPARQICGLSPRPMGEMSERTAVVTYCVWYPQRNPTTYCTSLVTERPGDCWHFSLFMITFGVSSNLLLETVIRCRRQAMLYVFAIRPQEWRF